MTDWVGSEERTLTKDRNFSSAAERPLAAVFGQGESLYGNVFSVSDGSAWWDGLLIPEHTPALTPVVKLSLGSPVALVTDALITAATSTELPNNGTKTYTTADAGTTPLDSASLPTATNITYSGASVSVFPLDVPRNITLAVTHSTSIVALSVTIIGYDEYLVKVKETLSVTATGTSKTATGKKAFKYIQSIAITSAGDATTNTVNLGWGDTLGLPYKVSDSSDVMQAWIGGVLEATMPTTTRGDTSTATATTGDVRGTVLLSSAMAGTAVYVYMTLDISTNAKLYGVAQYGG